MADNIRTEWGLTEPAPPMGRVIDRIPGTETPGAYAVFQDRGVDGTPGKAGTLPVDHYQLIEQFDDDGVPAYWLRPMVTTLVGEVRLVFDPRNDPKFIWISGPDVYEALIVKRLEAYHGT